MNTSKTSNTTPQRKLDLACALALAEIERLKSCLSCTSYENIANFLKTPLSCDIPSGRIYFSVSALVRICEEEAKDSFAAYRYRNAPIDNSAECREHLRIARLVYQAVVMARVIIRQGK